MPLLLQYDSTAEGSDVTEAHGVGVSVQAAKNIHAIRASQAFARLTGMAADDSRTPYNQAASDSLRALLTPKLASMLKDQSPKDLLSKLNSNLESPEVNIFSTIASRTFFWEIGSFPHGRKLVYGALCICLNCDPNSTNKMKN